MKKNSYFKIAIALFSILLVIGCNPDDDNEPAPVVPEPEVEVVDWEKLETIQDRIYNIALIDGNLYATGIASYFFNMNLEGANEPQFFWSFVSRTGRYKFPVSNKVLASRSETNLFLFPSDNISSSTVNSIKMEDISADFRFFEDMPRWNSDIFGLTVDGIGLVPFRKVINGFAKNNPSFLLFRSEKEGDMIVMTESTIIDHEFINGYAETFRIDSFDNFFLVQVNNLTFKIDVNGQVSRFSEFRTKSVKIDDQIFSFQHNTSTNKIEVLRSDINGSSTGPIVLEDFNEIFTRGEYFNVNGEIILVFRNNIYHVKLNNNTIEVEELQNQNLDFGDIYNVTYVPDGKVLLSNICNTPNCGIFVKSLEDFFKEK
ncbi:MAG: hypothetical protein ACXIUQ_00070 [Cecembia sp.]